MPVYFIQETGNPNGAIKIGKSNNVRSRLLCLQYQYKKDFSVLGVVKGSYTKETQLHHQFDDHKLQGAIDWFKPNGVILDYIKTNARPIDIIRPKACKGIKVNGESCGKAAQVGYDYCKKHDPRRSTCPCIDKATGRKCNNQT